MIRRLLLCSLLTLIGCTLAAPSPQLDGKIVGGFPINITQVPWQVSIMIRGQHICGGSIIGKNVILTAGHCLRQFSAKPYQIRVGSTDFLGGGDVYESLGDDGRIIMDGFDPYSLDYDYGLLILKENITFNDAVQKIKIPNVDDVDIENNSKFLVSGWGLTQNSTITNRYLRAVEVQRVDQELCNKAYRGRITPRMFCAGDYENGGIDACQGDSGGPVVVFDKVTNQPTLVGIVSWGKGCALKHYPGVYARVKVARKWIKSNSGI